MLLEHQFFDQLAIAQDGLCAPVLSLVLFNTYEPACNLPLYTRKKVSRPTNGSVITLNARAAKGSFFVAMSLVSLRH